MAADGDDHDHNERLDDVNPFLVVLSMTLNV